jgi:hypothetical protein
MRETDYWSAMLERLGEQRRGETVSRKGLHCTKYALQQPSHFDGFLSFFLLKNFTFAAISEKFRKSERKKQQ